MRPLELVIEGFRSFEERVVFDWRGRRLVAIVGPIGSGKSSILDAVVFALYGKTPAFERENKALIKHGAAHARVELSFEIDSQAWRVVRLIRPRGPSLHALYKGPADGKSVEGSTPELEKERAVTTRIEDLLGLDFHAFCRSVLLAQNRFAEFLNATTSDRDKVLKGVFGFDRIDGMHARSRERRSRAEADVKRLEDGLAHLGEDRDRLAGARDTLRRASERAGSLEAAEDEIRSLDEELREAARRRENADRRRTELDELAAQMPAADEVEAVLGTVESADRDLSAAEDARQTARDEAARAEIEREQVIGEVGSTEDHARAEAQIENLVAAGEKLDERRRRHEEATARHVAARRDLRRAEEARSEAEKQLRRAQVAELRASTALHEARSARGRVERSTGSRQDLERARESLDRLRRAADEVEDRRARLAETDAALERSGSDLEVRRRDLEAGERAEKEAEAEVRRAEEELRAAEDEIRRAERGEMALTLAATLEAGEPCPVCEQVVHEMPVERAPPGVAAARARLEELRGLHREVRVALRDASRQTAARAEAVRGGERIREDLVARRRTLSGELELREQECQGLAAALGHLPGEGGPEDRLTAARLRLDGALDHEARCEGELVAAQQTLRDLAHSLEMTRQQEGSSRNALDSARQRLDESTAERREAEASAEAVRGTLRALLGSGDPAELLERARARLAEVDQRLAKLRRTETSAAQDLAALRRHAESARRGQSRFAQRLSGLAGHFGLLDGAETESPRELLRRVEKRLADARRESEDEERAGRQAEGRNRARRDEIFRDLELPAAASFSRALLEARAARERHGATVAELEKRLERAAALTEELAAARRTHRLYRQLTDDLSAPKFLRYLLDEERAALAGLGSERFEMLSGGRYRFTPDGGFDVVDLANAEAVRKSDTLSGGETFLASLALALALAEKVTGSGGRLDAFFLDEGFGSLDEEHLDLAMEGIERLVTDSPNRLVTVVSHVPRMKEQIEDLIVLDKDPLTGNTIVRVGAAIAELP